MRARPLAAVLLLPLLLAGAAARGQRPELRIAMQLMGDLWVDPPTAQAAARPLFDLLAQQAGLVLKLENAPDDEVLLQRLADGGFHFAATSTLTYAKLSGNLKLIPVARPLVAGKTTFQVLLLVRRDSGLRKLADLENKRLSLSSSQPIHRVFLEVALRRAGAREPERFFSALNQRSQQSAVLEVFLREGEACLVTDTVFDAMCELNPQLRKTLEPLLTSQALSNFPLFAGPRVTPDLLATVTRLALELRRSETGRQLFRIFKVEGLVPAAAGDFRSALDLWREHEKAPPKGPAKTRRTKKR